MQALDIALDFFDSVYNLFFKYFLPVLEIFKLFSGLLSECRGHFTAGRGLGCQVIDRGGFTTGTWHILILRNGRGPSNSTRTSVIHRVTLLYEWSLCGSLSSLYEVIDSGIQVVLHLLLH